MRSLSLDDPELTLADLMRRWPETLPVFIARGMLCVGCYIGPFQTIRDACIEYAVDRQTLLAELRAAIRLGVGPAGQVGVAQQP